ncbi:MAG TPA: peptidoglycan DD-metalloendopeptidase family protein [Candidatus Magasanikbacteria bacterium]|nr:peptidoglycan DD-metalloendopeptidase family protein [Candidatus Magasanikbacteria bacterium]
MPKSLKLFIVCFIATLFLAPIFVYSQTANLASNKDEIESLNKEISARKDKIKQLEDTISVYKKNISQKQTEAVSLKNQLSILENKIKQTEAEIKMIQLKIDETKLEIEALQLSIEDKQKAMDRQKVIISQIIRNIHANDQKNYLEILLTNDTFADFYNQVQYLESIYVDLGRSVKNLRVTAEDLADKKSQVEAKKKIYEEQKFALENKKLDFKEQSGDKQDLLAETRASEMKYQTLLESLKRQYQVIEGEVRSYEEQVRKKLAEQEKFKNLSGSGELSWPVPSHYITASFHDSTYSFRNVFEHNAIDIRASQGTAVRAATAGYVGRTKRCTSSSCYSYVLLIHTGNLSTVYGHLSSISVNEDDFVNRGDIIGYSGGKPGTVGAGPFTTGPHLHFEVRKSGIPVDPTGYLKD